jgi:hypothetical protein
MNAEMRSAVSVNAESKNVESEKNLLTGGASYKLTTLLYRPSRQPWAKIGQLLQCEIFRVL